MENKKRKDGKTGSSILTCVLVCFVLIAVYGIVSQLKVSYAFPDTLEEIKNVKEVYPSLVSYTNLTAPEGWYTPEKKIVGNILIEGKTTPTYAIDMFCLEKSKTMPPATTNSGKKIIYKRASNQSIIDEGINYIVLKAYNDNNLTESTSGGVKTVHLSDNDYYDAQMALWAYQNIINNAGDSDMNNIWSSVSASSTGDKKKVYDYVTGAQAAKNSTAKNGIDLNGKVEFNKTSDGNYYETGDLTVSITTAPNTEFTGFKLTISNDSKVNIDVVDSTNTVIQPSEYATKIGSGQSFKFRIKKEDLPENTTVGVSGKIEGNFEHMGFEAYEGYYEDDLDNPKDILQIVLVPVTKSTPKSIELSTSIEVEDTGAGNSGYIYIIGALVLIVGLTIIYVNTKVQES